MRCESLQENDLEMWFQTMSESDEEVAEDEGTLLNVRVHNVLQHECIYNHTILPVCVLKYTHTCNMYMYIHCTCTLIP